MTGAGLPAYAHERLVGGKGLTLDAERTGGPMGSATWRLTNGIVDIEVYSDRGKLGAAAGKHGGRTFQVSVWARVLRASATDHLAFEPQVDFFADHLEPITRIVEGEPDIETKLRDVNWVAVRDRLGLSPDAQRGAPGTWTH
jgi:hypothetical protein